MVKETAGYVVQQARGRNFFLSRTGHFVKRRDRGGNLGITRAYIHTAEGILSLRKDIMLNAVFYPAVHNQDYVIVSTEGGMGFEEFLEIEKSPSLCRD